MKYQNTILIVDDEAIMRDILHGLLVTQGYNFAFASNGEEALAKAAEIVPDLILLDVMMPNMDGFETCQRIRANSLLAEVPIIMVTALEDRESRLRGIQAGADDFLTKPLDTMELQVRVQAVIRLNRYRRLLMERHKLEWVIEQDKDGYLLLSEHDEILYANPQARQYLGLLSDNYELGTDTFQAVSHKLYHCEPSVAWATWPALPPIPSPRYLVRPDSSVSDAFWLQVDLMEMSSASPEKYLVRLHDITADVVAQSLMWTFHGQVEHKLKTPLAKLTGFVGLLRSDRAMLSKADQDDILKIVDTSAHQLQDEVLAIFQYLEAVSMAKRGRSCCKLAEIEAVVAQVASSLELKPIEVFYKDLDDVAGTYIPTSRQTLELILWELLENAKKFHPTQSPTLEVKIFGVSRGVCLHISDDGLTLLPEQLTHMWTPYYQLEKYFSGQVPGMGLGLAMVASLAWGIGGTCRSCNRADGPGIVIELELPAYRE